MLKQCYKEWRDYNYGRSFDSLIKDLTEFQNELLESGASSIEWTLEVTEEYGSASAYFSVAYQREETDKEQKDRLAEEARIQNSKRQRYEQLKKEFGDA